MSAPDALQALRELVAEIDSVGTRAFDLDAARAIIAKADAPLMSRWRCPCCKSRNVQISLPAWYYETIDHDLVFSETDGDADISWWYCDDCDESGDGQPEDVLDDAEVPS